MSKTKITIEVVSDVVCPWCYIGKRRMERAVDRLKEQYEFIVFYSPFELNPQMPKEGVNQREYLSTKFGGEERYHQITGHVTQLAAKEGLKFDFDRQQTSPNTRDAHRLLWLAGREGRQNAVKDGLLKAHFEDGIDLSVSENLAAIGAAAGMEKAKVLALLESTDGVAEVEHAEQLNHDRGITGVPFFIINNKYGVSGAQPSDTFEKVLREIGSEPLTRGELCETENRDR